MGGPPMTPEELADLQREEARMAEAFAALEAERDAAIGAKRRAERERDQMGQRIEQGRRAAVVYVERIAEVETERDAALAEVGQLRAEVRRLRAALGGEVRRNSIAGPPSGAPDSVVRSWAREHNIPANPKGRVAPDVRAAYEAAWRAEQDGDETDA